MTNWSAGYVSDVPYISGFYRELAPSHLRFIALSQNVQPPALGRDTTYCDLGCGQGLSTNLLAATNPDIAFWGFDFNAGQIANARRAASEAALSNVVFEDKSVEELLVLPRGALPQFDIVVLHGLYSWVSAEVRHAIVRFLDRYLKVGGLAYVSYNALPGMASIAPLQRLMEEHARRNPDRSDLQATAAASFANRLVAGKAAYFAQHPAAAKRVDSLGAHKSAYLAHEYMNDHWEARYHADVAREMSAARLTYVGAATITDNIDAVYISGDLQDVLASTRDRVWQETLRDYIANRQFRRDVFIRGAVTMTPLEQRVALEDLTVALVVPRASAVSTFQGPLGKITGNDKVYGPIFDALATGPQTIKELASLPAMASESFGSIIQAVSLLLHSEQVQLMADHSASVSRKQSIGFNRFITRRLCAGEALDVLAAPALGSAVPASFIDLLCVLAIQENPDVTPRRAAERGLEVMQQTGQRLIRNGTVLGTSQEIVAELTVQMERIWTEKVPLWRHLGAL